MPDSPIIAIVGPIGAGKSTLATALSRALNVPVQAERVADNPYFERFCTDPASWAFHAQVAFMVGAFEAALALHQGGRGGILERPIAEMFGVFVTDQLRRHVITQDDYDTLQRLRELSAASVGEPDIYVFLSGDPRVLMERIRRRGRPGEDEYDLAYLDELDRRYRAWHDELAGTMRVISINVVEEDMRTDANVAALAARLDAAMKTDAPAQTQAHYRVFPAPATAPKLATTDSERLGSGPIC